MKKVLILASVASMIDQFNMPNIHLLQDVGYEVHVACNFEKGSTCSEEKIEELKQNLKELNVKGFQIDFARNVFKLGENIKAYRQVIRVLKSNNYNFIHCHSPIGGVIGRLAAHKTNTKVIYTAHGFHFFKGAPIKNWLLYYPVERFLARYTDVLITINKEDFKRAEKFKTEKIEYIPGVGIDINKFRTIDIDKFKKRKELGIPEDAFVVLSVGELNKNKNHEVIIRALARINNSSIHYIICGQGSLKIYLVNLANKLGIEKQVHLLGFRQDIMEIYKSSDIFAFPSKREGLGMSALEAMASGLPLITSNIHGIVDYSINGKSGYVYNSGNINGFSRGIIYLFDNQKLRDEISKHNKDFIRNFKIENVQRKMKNIYGEII